ncbi:MAG: NAD-dependent epimerase/dehydratase family protein, partial [Proteobacteria bacterium]|nr:NAD-dependent epimerase/dehydratase family protein [Pseudomonadota bacterium]
MTVLVTGAAGFIGFSVASALLARGESVVGFDNFDPYYDVRLKEARGAELSKHRGFRMVRDDIASDGAFAAAISDPAIDRVVHLAAQAGVRYSITNPDVYIRTNIIGHFNVVEACRRRGGIKHLVYASSSSVYGGNEKLPFAVDDKIDRPVSLYAATKAANELVAHCYSHLYGLPATGLRFFTVYGPWGRPDMALWIFTKAILAGQPIQVFNNGKMRRDFTYIDDIVAGVIAALDRAPAAGASARHRIYNLGNHKSEPLLRYIELIERATNHKAILDMQPLQAGDVPESFADIAASTKDLGFRPHTSIDEGVPKFVEWFRAYNGV